MAKSKFDKLADKIAKEYRKDGDSAEKAKEIGEATAAKIGFAKYGKRGMERKARAGRDAESFESACGCGSGSCGCGVEVHIHDAESKRRGPYVFPKRKAYPIGNLEHAKLALTFSTWPDNKKDAKKVRDAVFKRYPELRDWFKDGKYAKHAESFSAEKRCKLCRDLRKELKIARKQENRLIEIAERCGAWEGNFDFSDINEKYDACQMCGSIPSGCCEYEAESFDAEYRFQNQATTSVEADNEEEAWERFSWIDPEEIWVVDKMDAESFEAEKIEGQTQSNIYAKFFVGHVSNDELRGNGKFKTYDSAVKKAKEVAKKEGNSRVVSPMGAALWTSNDKGLFQAGHLTKEAKRFYNSEEEMVTGYLSAESILYDAPISAYDEYCIGQGRFCVMERLPGKNLCRNCHAEFGDMFPQDAEYTALGVPTRRLSAKEIMSPLSTATRNLFIIAAALVVLNAASATNPKGKLPSGNTVPSGSMEER